MVRNARPKGVISAPFGFCFFVFATSPTQIGFQDVAALVARQPAVTAHWHQHIRASAFGTIHAATFSFSRPVGTNVPKPLSYQLASLDPGMVMPAPWNAPPAGIDDLPVPFPKVDRTAKGDKQPVLHPQLRGTQALTAPEELPAAAASAAEPPAPAPPGAEAVESAAAPDDSAPKPEPVPASAPEEKPAAAAAAEPAETAETPSEDIPDPVDAVVAEVPEVALPGPPEPMMEMARLYFGNEPLGDTPGVIEKWAPGEEPTIIAPVAPADPDIKLSALDPKQAPADAKGGESVAPKGEVTGEGRRPLSPAERLNLEGKDRAKAEKCLADAVYFEARGEPVRGQIAVAQVVMNRVFSGFYPRSVCGTVYQNKHRRLACQFTFACDGIPDVITEPNAWVRASRIAHDVLDGKYWLPEVSRATHYHAYWVHPSWVREMKRLYKFGVHTFYRPRKWGDGSEVPSWGTAAATNEAIAKL